MKQTQEKLLGFFSKTWRKDMASPEPICKNPEYFSGLLHFTDVYVQASTLFLTATFKTLQLQANQHWGSLAEPWGEGDGIGGRFCILYGLVAMNQGIWAQCWEPGKLQWWPQAPHFCTAVLPVAWCWREAQPGKCWETRGRVKTRTAWEAAALTAGQEEIIPLIHLLFPLPIMPAASLASQGGCEDSLVNVCEALYRWRELCKC